MYTAVVDIGTPGKTLGWAARGATGPAVDGTGVDDCIRTVFLRKRRDAVPAASAFPSSFTDPAGIGDGGTSNVLGTA